LVASMLALQRGRPRLATVAASVAMLEPHIALPACLALWLYEPRARRTLLAAGALALGLSLLLGPRTLVEYFTQVLPLHARSETVADDDQYSLSALLYALGAVRPLADRLGELSYLLTLGLGLWLAGRASRALGEPAYLVALPIAAAVLFGPFVHDHQMVAALPAALLLYGAVRLKPRARRLALAACVALAVPLVTLADLDVVRSRLGPTKSTTANLRVPPIDPQAIAEVPYALYVERVGRYGQPYTLPIRIALKTPTWLALFVVLGLAWRLSAVPSQALASEARRVAQPASG
ncbi:MAG: hypothetical protein ACREQ5_39425, partial [Candidatus Dormibacteria bacterium]